MWHAPPDGGKASYSKGKKIAKWEESHSFMERARSLVTDMSLDESSSPQCPSPTAVCLWSTPRLKRDRKTSEIQKKYTAKGIPRKTEPPNKQKRFSRSTTRPIIDQQRISISLPSSLSFFSELLFFFCSFTHKHSTPTEIDHDDVLALVAQLAKVNVHASRFSEPEFFSFPFCATMLQ